MCSCLLGNYCLVAFQLCLQKERERYRLLLVFEKVECLGCSDVGQIAEEFNSV